MSTSKNSQGRKALSLWRWAFFLFLSLFMLDGQGWHFQTFRYRGSENEAKIKCEHCWKMSSAPLTWSDYIYTESWTVGEIDKVKKFAAERSSALYWSPWQYQILCTQLSIEKMIEIKKKEIITQTWESIEGSGFIWQRSLCRFKI